MATALSAFFPKNVVSDPFGGVYDADTGKPIYAPASGKEEFADAIGAMQPKPQSLAIDPALIGGARKQMALALAKSKAVADQANWTSRLGISPQADRGFGNPASPSPTTAPNPYANPPAGGDNSLARAMAGMSPRTGTSSDYMYTGRDAAPITQDPDYQKAMAGVQYKQAMSNPTGPEATDIYRKMNDRDARQNVMQAVVGGIKDDPGGSGAGNAAAPWQPPARPGLTAQGDPASGGYIIGPSADVAGTPADLDAARARGQASMADLASQRWAQEQARTAGSRDIARQAVFDRQNMTRWQHGYPVMTDPQTAQYLNAANDANLRSQRYNQLAAMWGPSVATAVMANDTAAMEAQGRLGIENAHLQQGWAQMNQQGNQFQQEIGQKGNQFQQGQDNENMRAGWNMQAHQADAFMQRWQAWNAQANAIAAQKAKDGKTGYNDAMVAAREDMRNSGYPEPTMSNFGVNPNGPLPSALTGHDVPAQNGSTPPPPSPSVKSLATQPVAAYQPVMSTAELGVKVPGDVKDVPGFIIKNHLATDGVLNTMGIAPNLDGSGMPSAAKIETALKNASTRAFNGDSSAMPSEQTLARIAWMVRQQKATDPKFYWRPQQDVFGYPNSTADSKHPYIRALLDDNAPETLPLANGRFSGLETYSRRTELGKPNGSYQSRLDLMPVDQLNDWRKNNQVDMRGAYTPAAG